jgi:lysosomal alpha-glucosidase
MKTKLDWTYDTINFKNLPDIVKDLHAHGQHYINIIDPAISNTPGYIPYESGLKDNIFIKPVDKEEPLVGVVWPGQTVFPDFTHPNTTLWWIEQATRFHAQIPFDGLWIDMNEPSNFLYGSIDGCPQSSKYDNPPFTPHVMDDKLPSRTLCPSARQYLSNHYNLHNMYGHFEAMATNMALRAVNVNKRPFVLTRSSFAGTGHFAAHWSGDNFATWEDMYYSIPNMLNFNMFGVAQVGSDICGFSGNTNEELCIRWMQLGSFYPFMRNHNNANGNLKTY